MRKRRERSKEDAVISNESVATDSLIKVRRDEILSEMQSIRERPLELSTPEAWRDGHFAALYMALVLICLRFKPPLSGRQTRLTCSVGV